VQIVKEQEEHR